ncbi:uncharacterized protein Rv2082-like [Anopheles bellator]|uniref:uncharacterized protein Rv2082-like n=1 Tax=Anopheles bellator TaxID=139047 RepID=UPI002648255E|nr:uncharacterized protein Rv2082-like [Anopheles bellator]
MLQTSAAIFLFGVLAISNVFGAALNDNIDIDIKVDTDSKLYHQGKTVEGSFNYGYVVPRQNYNQFQHKVKGPDDVTYGCYGFVDPQNGTHLYHYVSDMTGYRVVAPNKPTTVYSAHVANSVAGIYDATGIKYDWDDLYLPDVCRVLQNSKDERNELSIPEGFRVNDDGTVTQTTQAPPPTSRRPEPASTVRTTTPPTTPRPTTPRPTTARPTTPRQTTARPTTPRPTTARPTTPPQTTARPTTPRPTTARPTPARTAAPRQSTQAPSPSTTRPRTAPATTATRQPTEPRQEPPATTRRPAPTTPRPTPKKSNAEQPTKTSGNKFGPPNGDNLIGQPTNNLVQKPPRDLDAVGYEIQELRTMLQMLLKQLGPSRSSGPAGDCGDEGLGAVDPNAKQVFLPLVIVDSLPGAKSAQSSGLPPGSQFAIPSVGYGSPSSRCGNCG